MNRLLTSLSAAALFASGLTAQISYSFDFDANSTGWTGDFTRFTGASACGGTGGAMRRNLYSGATTGQLISPSVGTATGVTVTLDYTYKVNIWSANTSPAAAPFGSITPQYGATATGPWTNIATYTDEVQSSACIAKSHAFTPPAGPLFIRFSCVWSGGDNYWNFDNIVMADSIACSGTPAPGNTTGAPAGGACAGVNFTLGLQNGTPGTGVTRQWYSSTVSGAGPWTSLGTAATQVTNQSVDSWYYCDVTCSSSTGSSAVVAVPMASIQTNLQTFSTGTATPNCWSSAAITVGAIPPIYNAVSAYGVGTGTTGFDFWNMGAATSSALISPPLTTPVAPGDNVFFDVAGALWSGGLTNIDTVVLEESNDGGANWTLVVTMTNNIGDALNTAPAGGIFTPTASQWARRNYPLTAGSNRIRFRSVAGFGNNVFIDNVSVGAFQPAINQSYGVSCVSPAYSLTAAPAPVSSPTVITYSQAGIPEAVAASGVFFGVVVISLNQLEPGVPLTVLTAGAIDSPCNMSVSTFDLLVTYVSAVNTDSSVTLNIPVGTPAGFQIFAQGVALIAPVAPNNAGIVTSNAVKSSINSY